MIKIQQGGEEINSNGGNILIGALLQLKSLDKMNTIQTKRIKHGEVSHCDILKIATALLALGRNDFADVDLYRNDCLFKEALGLKKVPSAETLRQRLNDLGLCNGDQTLIDNCVVELLQKVDNFGKIQTGHSQYIPLDIDVSVMLQPNCKKEGVSWTYHNENGYAPIFCHVGTQGYMLANELRNGSQHSAKGAIEFVSRCIENARRIGLKMNELLIRVDSAHDDSDFIKFLHEAGVNFLVKRNLRNEVREQYLALARRCGEKLPSRDGKNIYRCTLAHRKPAGLEDIPLFMIVEVTERLTGIDGQTLLIPELEVSAWWTNLPESETLCINLYHAHATSEQFHSELKTDMGLERLPSSKFTTNALILNLATLAYNCLRYIGQEALNCKESLPIKVKVSRRRLRSVLQDLIYVGCKLTRHANTFIVRFGRHCPWFNCFSEVYAKC